MVAVVLWLRRGKGGGVESRGTLHLTLSAVYFLSRTTLLPPNFIFVCFVYFVVRFSLPQKNHWYNAIFACPICVVPRAKCSRFLATLFERFEP